MSDIQRLGLHAPVLLVIPLVLAGWVHPAFLFVSLGSIIYQVVEKPSAPASSPHSVIIGNGVALLVGYAALAVFGLTHAPSTVVEGVSAARALAVILAFAVTGVILALAKAAHPPAGATQLLVVLGFLTRPQDLVVVFGGAIVIAFTSVALNRLAGLRTPLWRTPIDTPAPV